VTDKVLIICVKKIKRKSFGIFHNDLLVSTWQDGE